MFRPGRFDEYSVAGIIAKDTEKDSIFPYGGWSITANEQLIAGTVIYVDYKNMRAMSEITYMKLFEIERNESIRISGIPFLRGKPDYRPVIGGSVDSLIEQIQEEW